MDFAQNQLLNIYIKEFSGLIWSRKHKQHLPVYQVYEDVMKVLYFVNDEGTEIYKSAREKILGKEYLKSAPPEYWEVLGAIDMGYSLEEWDTMSLRNRARILASRYVKNMVEIITAYYEEMEERLKKLNDKK